MYTLTRTHLAWSILVASVAVLLLAAAALITDWPLFAQAGDPPGQPARPVADSVSHDSVTISWSDPSDSGITGYQILRRNRDTDAAGDFTVIENDTGSSTTAYTDTGVSASSRYVYRVKARNSHGLSPASGFVNVETTAAPAPAAPTGLTGEVGSDSVSLSWDDPEDGDITGYQVLRRNRDTDDAGDFSVIESDTGSDATTYTDTGVSASSRYVYRVRARYSDSLSEMSGYFRADTPQPAPTPTPSPTPTPTATPEPTAQAVVADPQPLTAQQQMQELTAVSEGDSEDFPNDTSTTGRVLVDGDAFGKIEDAKDADWIKVDLDQYKPYEVRLRPKPGASDPLEDAYIRSIYDSNGYEVPRTSDDDGGGHRSSRVVFSARETGTHYIEARGFSGAYGDYKLSVRALSEDSDSHASKPETTGTLSLDEVTSGSIDRLADRDWFKITLEEDVSYRFKLRHLAGDQTKFPVYIAGVFKSDGSHIPGTEGRGTAAPVQYRSFTPTADGAHYVEVAVERTNFTQTGSYEISAETLTLPEDDILANSSTTGVISVGGEVTEEVDVPGDEDWFKVNLTKSDLDFYRVDVYSGNTESTKLANPYLSGVFHPDGHLLPDTVNSYTSWTQWHPNAYFAVEKTGNYYIAVGSTGGKGEYRVKLTKITDDFSADTSTTGTVAVDGSTTGNSQWEFEDSDWFKVALTSGTEYTISVKGKISNSTTHGTLWGPIIYALRDSSGNKISGTFAKGTSSTYPSITYTATATGDHYIDVRNPGETGTYTVSVSD